MTMAKPTQLIILRSFFEVFVIVAHTIFFSKTNQISRKQILLEIKKNLWYPRLPVFSKQIHYCTMTQGNRHVMC